MTSCKDCVARVFGVCRGDFCEAERVGLIERCERLATQGGHELSAFKKEKKRPVWHAQCVHCGRKISYTLDPEPGSPDIWGDLLDADDTIVAESATGSAATTASK